MSDTTPATETFGHGSIKLTYYPSSDRIGVEQTGVNSVMDSWELVRFVRELGLLAAHDAEVRAGVAAEEPEWEYGYTSKWGTIAASSQADAESRAADHTRGIAEARESGDLTYHGKLMKRIAASKPGEWVPVKQEGAETDA